MALSGYLSVTGAQGSTRMKNQENKSNVWGAEHAVGALRDATGYPTKDRVARHLVVTKEIDRASPTLHKFAHENTVIEEVKLELWRMPPSGGTEENYYVILAHKCQIDSIRTIMPFNRIEAQSLLPEYEQVAFSYKDIGFSFVTGGKAGGTDGKSQSNSGALLYDSFGAALNDAAGEMLKNAVFTGAADAVKGAEGMLGAVIEQSIKNAWEAGGKPPAGGG